MKVSVLMPTYNRGQIINGLPLVERAIQSVLNQDYEDFELLILNDGSTDNTSEIIQKYADHPKVKIWDYKTNMMPPNNMNFLWEQATGEVVCQMHDDDEMPRGSLSCRALGFKLRSGLDVIYGGWETQEMNGGGRHFYEGNPPDRNKIMMSEYINFTTLMYKRNLPFKFDAELRYYFDWLFKIRCLWECNTGYVRNYVMIHTVHPGQETSKCRRENANASQEKIMREKIKLLNYTS
jgi:glycosyltransferase involved in cell wall biosynthesis